MAYGTVKVNFITFDTGGGDQTITVADLNGLLTSSIAITGAITAQSINTISGTFTNVSGNNGRINTLTGTTASFDTGLFPNLSGVYVQYASGQILNLSGNAVSYTSGNFTNVSGDYFEYVSGVVTTLSGTTLIGTLSGNADSATKLASAQNFTLSGDITGTVSSDLASGFVINTAFTSGIIVNDDISAGANIADTKLDTISTSGKVSNSATTATSANTVSTIVARDGAGSFSANVVTATLSGDCTGNAATATNLSSNRNFTLTGDISGTVSSNLATGFSVNTTIASGVIVNADINASAGIVDTKLATITTVGKVANSATTATSANTISTIVARDGLGNFSAGVITATLSGNASTTTQLSSARTFSITGDVIGSVSSDLSTGADITVGIASSVIVNADVSPTAAIAGTKINPDFGSQNITTSGDLTADNIQVNSINNGPLAGFKNAIINGNFDIWQRGTTFSGILTGEFAADRWRVVHNGGGTRNIRRQPFTLGQTDVPGEPSYYLSFEQTVAPVGATTNIIVQPIESVRTFAGQQITVSFYAKSNVGITLDAVRATQDFGTGEADQVKLDLETNVAIGTTWQKYTFTGTVASIATKTISSGNIDKLSIAIRLPLTGTFIFDIARVQVEPGPVATPFESRPIAAELALCERYYQLGRSLFSGDISLGNGYSTRVYYLTSMRAAATITLTNISNTGFGTAGSVGTNAVDGFTESRTATSTGAGLYSSTFTAEAEL